MGGVQKSNVFFNLAILNIFDLEVHSLQYGCNMDERDMLSKLDGIPPGSKLFVSYVAGNEPTTRAIREAARAAREGYPRRYYFGTFTNVKLTKAGSWIMNMLCENRDDERTGSSHGYRSFNPSIGNLLALEVIE